MSTQSEQAALTLEENALETSARALSEFVIRVAVLPVTLLLAKPSALAHAHTTGNYRPLPSPFLLALVTGVVVSGLTSNISEWGFNREGSEDFTKAIFNFYGEMNGLDSVLFALPYMALVWFAAGLISGAMWRGVRSAQPLFAGLALCLGAIVEVAVIVILVGIVLRPQSSAVNNVVMYIMFGFVLFALILAIKVVRLVFVLRRENRSSWVGAVVAAVPTLFILVLSGVTGGGVSAAVVSALSQRVEVAADAESYLDAGDFSSAVTAYNEAIESNPNDATAFVNRARALRGQGDLDGAVRDYTQAIAIDPELAGAYYARGRIFFDQREYAGAVADYDSAIALAPTPALYNSRCWTRAVWGRQLDMALEDCNEALRLRPGEINTLDSRGLVYFRMGEFERSYADYSAALEVDPGFTPSRYVRGVIQLRLGRTEAGQADLAAVAEQDPDGLIPERYRGYGVTVEAPADSPEIASPPVAIGPP